ncbi:hypothetical protein FLX27_23540 [Agrobacterium tumefaciens]|nr:hypothetical protein [Agrobacterium tumefaciens]TQN59152.1 hypothetical protein FLX27_23540 [Agrobacterium tumefaciens]
MEGYVAEPEQIAKSDFQIVRRVPAGDCRQVDSAVGEMNGPSRKHAAAPEQAEQACRQDQSEYDPGASLGEPEPTLKRPMILNPFR